RGLVVAVDTSAAQLVLEHLGSGVPRLLPGNRERPVLLSQLVQPPPVDSDSLSRVRRRPARSEEARHLVARRIWDGRLTASALLGQRWAIWATHPLDCPSGPGENRQGATSHWMRGSQPNRRLDAGLRSACQACVKSDGFDADDDDDDDEPRI